MVAKIAFARQALAAFAEQVGRLGYDDRWISISNPSKAGQPHSTKAQIRKMHDDVYQQLTIALGHGLIEAQIFIALPSEETLKRQLSQADSASSDSASDNDSSNDGAWEDDHYVLCPSFWRKNWRSCVRDWKNSTLQIPLQFVRVSRSNPCSAFRPPTLPLFEAKPYLKSLEKKSQIGQILIKQSELAIAHISGIVPVFSNLDEDRYGGFKNRFIDELIAVVWRQLAIENIGRKRKKIKPRDFKRAMNGYIDRSAIDDDGSGTAASTIAAICGKLNQQFADRDIFSQPFVNSSPSDSKLSKARSKPK